MKACAISGSFNHFYDEVSRFHSKIKQENFFQILSPGDMTIRNQSTDFILLKSDISNDINKIEVSHLNAISNSNILFIINPKSYIGLSTAFEIGYAKVKNIPLSYSVQSENKSINETKIETYNIKSRNYLFLENRKKNRNYYNNLIEDIENKLNTNIILSGNINPKNLKNIEFLLIDNQNGKITINEAFKMGYAYALNIPILLTEEPSDILFKGMILPKYRKKSCYNFKENINIILQPSNYLDSIIDLFYHRNKSILPLI